MMYLGVMNDILAIGELLIRTRRASGLSQRELAAAINTSQQQIARWEATAYRTASLDRVAQAAQALEALARSGILAAEATAIYSPSRLEPQPAAARDLGDIAVRIRSHGREFSERFRFERIGVFGSFARGEQEPDSDVDLLVETNDPGGLRFLEAGEFAESILGRRVDMVRPETLKHQLRPRVDEEVIYVWGA